MHNGTIKTNYLPVVLSSHRLSVTQIIIRYYHHLFCKGNTAMVWYTTLLLLVHSHGENVHSSCLYWWRCR